MSLYALTMNKKIMKKKVIKKNAKNTLKMRRAKKMTYVMW
jgi:hypothetical protein